jgi:aminomethyltransferase
VREGVRETLVGFELLDRGVPRHGQRIWAAGTDIGVVTSGSFSPTLEKGVGMGYVPPGTSGRIEIGIRDHRVPAKIVSPPFYRKGSVRHN